MLWPAWPQVKMFLRNSKILTKQLTFLKKLKQLNLTQPIKSTWFQSLFKGCGLLQFLSTQEMKFALEAKRKTFFSLSDSGSCFTNLNLRKFCKFETRLAKNADFANCFYLTWSCSWWWSRPAKFDVWRFWSRFSEFAVCRSRPVLNKLKSSSNEIFPSLSESSLANSWSMT